jgi:hypothetical protein
MGMLCFSVVMAKSLFCDEGRLKPVHGSIARSLQRSAELPCMMHPVATARMESAFSKVAWIKSERRGRFGPAALQA